MTIGDYERIALKGNRKRRLITTLIVTAAFFGSLVLNDFVQLYISRNDSSGKESQELLTRLDRNALISRKAIEKVIASTKTASEGARGIRCSLSLPPKGSPGGRTDAEVSACFKRFDALVREHEGP